jgi:hypothetical protein
MISADSAGRGTALPLNCGAAHDAVAEHLPAQQGGSAMQILVAIARPVSCRTWRR